MFVGVLLIAYAGAVVFWRDPVTDVYAIYSQRNLGSKLQAEENQYVTLARQEQVAVAASVDTPAVPDAPVVSEADEESEKASRRSTGCRSGSRSSTTSSSARRSAASASPAWASRRSSSRAPTAGAR